MPFTKESLSFFRGLARNNEKAWFEAHRDEYERYVREPMRALIDEMNARFAKFAPEMFGDPKRSMFRINRDTRFSKDKSPYKTHAACWFHHRGASRKVGSEAQEGSAGFYFHLQPGSRSMLGGGIWMPPRTQLDRLREAIAEHHRGFERVVNGLPKRFDGLDEEHGMLKRTPRGFAEGHPAARWLKYQSFTTGRMLSDEEVIGPRLPALLAREYEAMLPLVRWLNRALGFDASPGRTISVAVASLSAPLRDQPVLRS